MDVKCFICKKIVEQDFVSTVDKSRCRECHIDWLRRQIVLHQESYSLLKMELNSILSKCIKYSSDEWSDSD